METNDKTKWINTVLCQMSKTDGVQATTAMENCGRECLKTSPDFKLIQKLRGEVGGTEDADLLFSAYKENVYNNSPRLTKHGRDIFLEYHECACGMVTRGGVTDPFLCNCTVGYTKQIFETWFGRPVGVRLMKSILRGDGICLQKITLM